MAGLNARDIAWLEDHGPACLVDGPQAFQQGDPAPKIRDGVYLGLPEGVYFGQDALGSTDLADLWLYREGWWWKSPHNPWRKPDDSTRETLFGSAAHTLLLEGEAAFKERWAVEPDPRHFPNLLVTVEDLVSALTTAGAPGNPSPRLGKKNLVELARVYLPDRHVWDAIVERFARQNRDREKITAYEAWVLRVMLEAAEADPNMRVVTTGAGGVHLAEVSIFWTLPDGLRLRFRFDSLLPSLNADLKTLGNPRDRDLGMAVGRRIGEAALDVQAAMSFVARAQLYGFLQVGAVVGGTDEQRAWLRRFPGEAPLDLGDRPGWGWLWMFYVKPDEGGRAPAIVPVTMTFGSLEHRDGYRRAMHGLAFYRQQVATVGLDKPWTRVEAVHHLNAAAPQTRVQIPPWVEQPIGVDDEERAMTWRN